MSKAPFISADNFFYFWTEYSGQKIYVRVLIDSAALLSTLTVEQLGDGNIASYCLPGFRVILEEPHGSTGLQALREAKGKKEHGPAVKPQTDVDHTAG